MILRVILYAEIVVGMFPELEIFIQRRETAKSLRIIKGVLASPLAVPEILYIAEAYRRLGFPSRAVKVLVSALQKRTLFSVEEKQQLQVVHLETVNLLGASNYALALVKRLSDKLLSPQERRRVANFYLANYDFKKALQLLESLQAESFSDYDWQFLNIAKADCFSGLSNWPAAMSTIEPLTKSSYALIAKIANTALGEYLVRQGRPQDALSLFLKIEISSTDSSVDQAFYWKWRALAELSCEEDSDAESHIKIAENYFNSSNQKPEALLDLYYWKGRFERDKQQKVSKAWKTALAYPAEYFAYRDEMVRELKVSNLSITNGLISLDRTVPGTEMIAYIDEGSDHCVVNERCWIGIPKKYLLLSKLVRAGTLGVQVWRLLDSLWPGDLSQHELLEKRLADLIEQLRSEGFMLEWKDHRLYCTDMQGITVCVSLGDSFAGQSFLETHCEFIRRDVEEFYNVARSRAGEIISQWRTDGRICEGSKMGHYRKTI